MKKLSGLIVFAILLLLPVCASATPIDVNIYSDTTISSGEYGTVNIYDTSPDQTTLTVMGGDISYCYLYDTSILNCSGGDLHFLSINNGATATISDIDYIAGVELHGDSELHIYDGGSASSISMQIFDNAELHVYGYGFVYDPGKIGTNIINGFWENDQAFTIYLRQPSNYDPYTQVILHVIPEPSTIFTLGLFSLFMRKRGNVLK